MSNHTTQVARRGGAVKVLTVGGFLAVTANAMAVGPQVIYTKIPTHPSSIVPGALDLAGQPAVTNFRALEQLFVSPDGSTWVIIARTQQGSDLETITLMGSGLSGTMFLQEGQPVPAGAAGELIDFFGSGGGRFDDNNNFALSLRARGGVASVFQKVILWEKGVFSKPFQMGDLYTGLVDQAPNPSGDETVGNSIGSIHLLNDGRIGSQDSTILQIHTSRRPAITYDLASFQQTAVTTFLSLDGTINHTYGTLSANTFYTSPDGKRWLVAASILGAPAASDTVLVVNGEAVLREDFPVGKSSAIVHSIVTTELASSGDWFSRGLRRVAGASNGVWAAMNGELIAQTGDPVEPGNGKSTEAWASSFLTFNGNNTGDWVLVGQTDNSDPAIDSVVVVNGRVVMREGDPIDLDGNGAYDDNVFIGRGNNTLAAFEANDAALTDGNLLYIFVNLRDGQGNDLNSNPVFTSPQAFVRLSVKFADLNGDGTVGAADLGILLGAWGDPGCGGAALCPADLNGDGVVGPADLGILLGNWGG